PRDNRTIAATIAERPIPARQCIATQSPLNCCNKNTSREGSRYGKQLNYLGREGWELVSVWNGRKTNRVVLTQPDSPEAISGISIPILYFKKGSRPGAE